jgi:hypothetical protein
VPQLFDALHDGDNEDEHKFSLSELRAMALKCEVSTVPRRSKPHTVCEDLKWLDELVNKVLAQCQVDD